MKLQIQNIAGEVLSEDNLIIGENDLLILRTTTTRAFQYFMRLSKEEMRVFVKAFEEEKIVIIPPDVEIKVIRRE